MAKDRFLTVDTVFGAVYLQGKAQFQYKLQFSETYIMAIACPMTSRGWTQVKTISRALFHDI